MRWSAIILSCLLLMGCASNKWRPEPIQPTRERILELAQVGPPVEYTPLPLQLYTVPKILSAYITFRIVCIIPTGIDGRYSMGIDGVFSQEAPITRKEVSYVTRAGCESMVAHCSYREYIPTKGYDKTKRIELKIEPVGECR